MTINEWLEISEMSGKGNAKVTLTALQNDGEINRSTQLVVKGRYGTKYVNIRQKQYLWVLLEEEGEISGIKSNTIQYSYDRESWTSFPSNGSITAPADTYVYFRNTSEDFNRNINFNIPWVDKINRFLFTTKGCVGGDLSEMGSMKLNNFYGMFYGNNNLTDSSSLVLPWTELAQSCYRDMFNGCTSLVNVPQLFATTLESYCYENMFKGCTSLVNAPELPSTALGYRCYLGMFEGCTSLTTAPQLPSTTLKRWCYRSMFLGCTSLTTAPELPSTTLAENCYEGMFANCTSLTTAPELLATTLKKYSYFSMFYGCSNLNYIKMLATDISASYCLTDWVANVAPTGIFVKHTNAELSFGIDGIPEGWTIIDATE